MFNSHEFIPCILLFLVGLVSGGFHSSAIIFSLLAFIIQSIRLDNHTNVLLVYGVIGTVFLTLTALFIFPSSRQELEEIINPNKCLILETSDVGETLMETTNISTKMTNSTVDDVLVISPANVNSHKVRLLCDYVDEPILELGNTH
jgi:hypothetical protein